MTSSDPSQNTQTFVQILMLLSQVTQCVQRGESVEKTTALLKETVSLVSHLSVSILVPDVPQQKARVVENYPSSPKVPSVTNSNSSDNGKEQQHEVFFMNARSSTISVPTSPSSASGKSTSTSPQPLHLSTPMGGPKTASFLHNNANRGLLTPPPSENKPTWSTAPGSGAQTRVPGSPMGTPLPGKGGLSGLGLGMGGGEIKGSFDLPPGFESSSDPATSDSDFYLRAMFHRIAGNGVQEAYDATLKLEGATIIDGLVFRFRITDAYFNPETYNYSESLSRNDGMSGFRYGNKNGSTYIRFEEPTGPRILFVRHANPPYVIPYSNSSAHVRTPIRSPPAASPGFNLHQRLHAAGHTPFAPYQMQQLQQLRAGPLGGERVMLGGSQGVSADGANKFSVQDFWN